MSGLTTNGAIQLTSPNQLKTALDVMLICPRGNERDVRRHRQRE